MTKPNTKNTISTDQSIGGEHKRETQPNVVIPREYLDHLVEIKNRMRKNTEDIKERIEEDNQDALLWGSVHYFMGYTEVLERFIKTAERREKE